MCSELELVSDYELTPQEISQYRRLSAKQCIISPSKKNLFKKDIYKLSIQELNQLMKYYKARANATKGDKFMSGTYSISVHQYTRLAKVLRMREIAFQEDTKAIQKEYERDRELWKNYYSYLTKVYSTEVIPTNEILTIERHMKQYNPCTVKSTIMLVHYKGELKLAFEKIRQIRQIALTDNVKNDFKCVGITEGEMLIFFWFVEPYEVGRVATFNSDTEVVSAFMKQCKSKGVSKTMADKFNSLISKIFVKYCSQMNRQ